MKYPCGIIRDLLPLYIDGVCGSDSAAAVENHLRECEGCRRLYGEMRSETCLDGRAANESEDVNMEESLKKVKGKINRKIMTAVICAAAAAVIFAVGYSALFTMPLKSISVSEVKADAEVYPLSDLASNAEVNDGSVVIHADGSDNSAVYSITIPDMPEANAAVSGDTIEKSGYMTSISWSSPYYIKVIKYDHDASGDGKTLYVTGFKTSVLGNKPSGHTNIIKSMEFREIDRIVYVDEDGAQTEMWHK